jgi:hypothetical protein
MPGTADADRALFKKSVDHLDRDQPASFCRVHCMGWGSRAGSPV